MTYVYTKNPVAAADLTVLYKDTEGNTIATDKKVSGNIGDTFDVTTSEFKLDITGYTFARIEGTPTGTLSDQAQTVTYVYTKDPVVAADLTVLYKDTEGNTIATDKKVSGNIGDTFDVTTSEFKLDITGYTFARIEGTPTGTLSDQAQTVTYVYTKLKEEIVQPVKPEELTTLPKTGVGNGVLMMGTVISTLGLILVGRKKED